MSVVPLSRAANGWSGARNASSRRGVTPSARLSVTTAQRWTRSPFVTKLRRRGFADTASIMAFWVASGTGAAAGSAAPGAGAVALAGVAAAVGRASWGCVFIQMKYPPPATIARKRMTGSGERSTNRSASLGSAHFD